MWKCESMKMVEWWNERMEGGRSRFSSFSLFLIFALSYSHILTLHSAALPVDYTPLDGLRFPVPSCQANTVKPAGCSSQANAGISNGSPSS